MGKLIQKETADEIFHVLQHSALINIQWCISQTQQNFIMFYLITPTSPLF